MKYLKAALPLSALLVGIALTVWGLIHLPWPQALPWAGPRGFVQYLAFMAVVLGLIVAGTFLSKRNPIAVGAVLAACLALLSGELWPLLVTLSFALASMLLGKWLLSVLKIKVGENLLNNFLVGAGGYGTAVGLLAHFPVNYPGLYGFALVLPIVLWWQTAADFFHRFTVLLTKTDEETLANKCLDGAICVVALVYFVVALMPELGFDALWQHMFVAARLSESHYWAFDATTYVWAVIPMLGDWIFSVSHMLAGEAAARLTNVGFIFVLAWLLRDIVLWSGGSLTGARWAALIFLSTPLTFTEGSTLFIESVFAAFVLAGILSVLKFCFPNEIKREQMILAGTMLGCALATKAITLMAFPALLLVMIWRYKEWLRPNLAATVALATLLFLGLCSPPYLNAWWFTGNPVFPFFNKIFQSTLWHPVNFEASAFGKGISWDVLYQVMFHSDRYLEAQSGAAGFQWLMLFVPAAVILMCYRQVRGLVLVFIGVSSIVITFYSTAYLRYIFPFCIILIAAIGVAICLWVKRSAYVRNVFGIVGSIVVLSNLAFLNSGSFYADFPLRAIFAGDGRSQYLTQRLPIRKAVDLVNQLNANRSPVAIFSAPLAAGLHADALYADWTNMRFQQEIGAAREENDLVEVLSNRGVSLIILDSNWNGAGCCTDGPKKQALLEEVTIKIADYGSISVRKLKAYERFRSELLKNPGFLSTNHWTLGAEARPLKNNTGGVLVDVNNNASQWIAVSPGNRYLDSVVSRCFKEKTEGRIQVNWLGSEGGFLSTDIKTFECNDKWTEYTMEVAAPMSAHGAVVYASGHRPVKIEFKSVSFRK